MIENSILVELIKQGPPTLTLISIGVIAISGFKYYAAYSADMVSKEAGERQQLVEILVNTQKTINTLSKAIDASTVIQGQLVKAIEGLACFERVKVFSMQPKNGTKRL